MPSCARVEVPNGAHEEMARAFKEKVKWRLAHPLIRLFGHFLAPQSLVLSFSSISLRDWFSSDIASGAHATVPNV